MPVGTTEKESMESLAVPARYECLPQDLGRRRREGLFPSPSLSCVKVRLDFEKEEKNVIGSRSFSLFRTCTSAPTINAPKSVCGSGSVAQITPLAFCAQQEKVSATSCSRKV